MKLVLSVNGSKQFIPVSISDNSIFCVSDCIMETKDSELSFSAGSKIDEFIILDDEVFFDSDTSGKSDFTCLVDEAPQIPEIIKSSFVKEVNYAELGEEIFFA